MWGDKSTEQILRGPLDEARGLWRDKGLDDDQGWFKWDVQDDRTYCSDRENRGEFLLVMYAGVGVEDMATTPGTGSQLDPGNTQTSFENLGPRMRLSEPLTMGHRSVVTNYAHEMGHAWGFHHEHQIQTGGPKPGAARHVRTISLETVVSSVPGSKTILILSPELKHHPMKQPLKPSSNANFVPVVTLLPLSNFPAVSTGYLS